MSYYRMLILVTGPAGSGKSVYTAHLATETYVIDAGELVSDVSVDQLEALLDEGKSVSVSVQGLRAEDALRSLVAAGGERLLEDVLFVEVLPGNDAPESDRFLPVQVDVTEEMRAAARMS